MSRDHAKHSASADVETTEPKWPALRYGEIEGLLIELSGGDQRSVLGRFRNLRQMPFPDAIRTGMGNKVGYNLPHLLALCAVYELNALLIPQSHAVAIVQDTWPELVRGFIVAGVEAGLAARPEFMPRGLSATVSITPDGFAPKGQPSATAALVGTEGMTDDVADASVIRLDCAALMAVIASHAVSASHDPESAAAAFADLDRSFGWSRTVIPQRAAVEDLLGGSNFLNQGPYLARADTFLKLAAELIRARDEDTPVRRRTKGAAQRLLDYLGHPAPIDEWKGDIGTEEGRPRVKHQLAAIGELAGLQVTTKWPDVILTASGSPLEEAAATIAAALRAERIASAQWIEKARVSAAAARKAVGRDNARDDKGQAEQQAIAEPRDEA